MTQKTLICDDSGMARKQMSRALPKDWDVEVTFAKHGEDALEKIRAGAGDLLFLDLNMPVLDGYGVLEEINRADLPVMTIVVSGDIQPEARSRVQKLGAMDFIKKPTDPERVGKILTDFGLYREGEEVVTPRSETATPNQPVPEGRLSTSAYLQEMSNVAMGQAADLLARLLDVFVRLPAPRVRMIARCKLAMAL